MACFGDERGLDVYSVHTYGARLGFQLLTLVVIVNVYVTDRFRYYGHCRYN